MTAHQALQVAYQLQANAALDEASVLDALRQAETRLAGALLAVAATVPLAVVERAAALRSAKGLVSLAWKAGFTMRVAGPLQALLGQLPPPDMLEAGPGGGFPMVAEEMRWQLAFLGQMDEAG